MIKPSLLISECLFESHFAFFLFWITYNNLNNFYEKFLLFFSNYIFYLEEILQIFFKISQNLKKFCVCSMNSILSAHWCYSYELGRIKWSRWAVEVVWRSKPSAQRYTWFVIKTGLVDGAWTISQNFAQQMDASTCWRFN